MHLSVQVAERRSATEASWCWVFQRKTKRTEWCHSVTLNLSKAIDTCLCYGITLKFNWHTRSWNIYMYVGWPSQFVSFHGYGRKQTCRWSHVHLIWGFPKMHPNSWPNEVLWPPYVSISLHNILLYSSVRTSQWKTNLLERSGLITTTYGIGCECSQRTDIAWSSD